MNIQNYSTNFGLCIVFQNESHDLIYATSDYNALYNEILHGDSELHIGRKISYDDNEYKIIDLQTFGNTGPIDIDYLSGKQNKYSYKLTFTIKKLDV